MHKLAVLGVIAAFAGSSAIAQDVPTLVDKATSYIDSADFQDGIQQVSYQTCDQGCGGCGEEGCGSCCEPFWAHKHTISADWLFLTPRQQTIDIATPVDGTTNTAVPVGQTVVLDPGFHSGIRIGGGLAIDKCSSFTFSWSNYQSNEESQTQLPGGGPAPNAFLRSDLVHPNTVDVAADSLVTSGQYGIDYSLLDAGYTKTLTGDCGHRLNGTIGFRYANLEQDLRAQHQILGTTMVQTDIDFDGYGPRFALDYERMNCRGLLMYFRGGVSLLMGRFDASYLQTSAFQGQQAAAGFFEDRIVPQYELELGTGWESCNGGFRITAGYLINAWGNVLTTPAFIDGVQIDELDDIDETLTFDGLAIRAQILF